MTKNFKQALLDPTYLVTYYKKNGDKRTIRCKVEKDYCEHPSGKKEYVVVYDLLKHDWRTINTDTIESFEVIA